MTAEQQLERSVLEGKERDELSAIAQAMSLKTTTRTKKADIIDRILDATGVTSNGEAHGTNGSSNGDTPNGTANGTKPARRPRAAATVAASPRRRPKQRPSPSRPSPRKLLPALRATAAQPFSSSRRSSRMGTMPVPHSKMARAPRRTSRTGIGPTRVSRIRTIAITRTTIRVTEATSATDVGVGGVAGSVASVASCRGAAGKSSRTQAKWSRSRACSTCVTKATAFCVAVATCRRRRTSTSPSARLAGSPYARVTTSRARAAPRRTMRSIRHCSASTPCPGSTPKRHATAPASRISLPCFPTPDCISRWPRRATRTT